MTVEIQIIETKLDTGQDRSRNVLTGGLAEGISHYKALSLVRSEPTWVRPFVYPTLQDHSEFSSSLILLKSPDWRSTTAMYPIGTLQVDHNLVVRKGKVYSNLIRGRGEEQVKGWVVIVKTEGRDQRDVVKIAVQEARRIVGSGQNGRGTSASARTSLWDGIGVCTWEALCCNDNRPHRDLLLSLVPSYPIDTFLIDDGWQNTREPHWRQRLLTSFEPWSGFNASLRTVVDELKHRGVKQVGVWMTLNGYWNGIDPQGPLCAKYECRGWIMGKRGEKRGVDLLEEDPEDLECWLPSPEKAEQFWIDWFGYLKDEGISFVKVDNQAMYDPMIEPGANESLKALWKGMLNAVVHTWGSQDRVIMCMSHTPLMLNGPGGLDFDRPKGHLVFRNSDDFNLKYPDRHKDFISWNLYTSILTDNLSFFPDFDMFSTGPEGRLPNYHALLRAFSPGPMFISDSPGNEPNMNIINGLTAMYKDGRRRGVKSDTSATVLPNRWFWDNISSKGTGPALMAGLAVPRAQGGMIGAWNVRREEGGEDAIDQVRWEDVQDVIEGEISKEGYVVYELEFDDPASQRRYAVFGEKHKGELGITLEKGTAKAYVVARIFEMGQTKIAIIGSIDKFAPLSGLTVSDIPSRVTVESDFVTDITVIVFGSVTNLNITYEDDSAVTPKTSTLDNATLLQLPFGEDEQKWKIHISPA